MKILWNGIPIPETGDGILEAWKAMALGLGVGIPVASVAAARTLLTQAEAEGAAPTSSNPATFLIGEGPRRVQYVSDGSKANGVWVLAPVNEVEGAEAQVPSQGSWAFASAGDVYEVMNINLGVRTYDRRLQIQADLYGSVSGSVDLGIHCQGRAKYARFSSGGSSQSVTMQKLIPAGTSPLAQMVVTGASAGASISVANWDTRWSGISVLAFPVAM